MSPAEAHECPQPPDVHTRVSADTRLLNATPCEQDKHRKPVHTGETRERTLPHRAFYVAHDQAVLVVQELDAHLRDLLDGRLVSKRWPASCSAWGCLPRQGPATLGAGSRAVRRNEFPDSRSSQPPHLSAGACATDDLHNDRKLHGLVLRAECKGCLSNLAATAVWQRLPAAQSTASSRAANIPRPRCISNV